MYHITDTAGRHLLPPLAGTDEELDAFCPAGQPEDEVLLGLVLDTETTGLSAASDRVVEIAVRPFGFTRDGRFWGSGNATVGMQDPGIPIPPEVTAVNGIRDEDVKGKTFNWRSLGDLYNTASLIIAHNAKFDRPFVIAEFSRADVDINSRIPWACSMDQIDWLKQPFCQGRRAPSRSLEVLLAWNGFCYPPHRAEADTHATLFLLCFTGRLGPLIDAGLSPSFSIYVQSNKNFAANQSMRDRGYKFDNTNKVWWKGGMRKESEALEERAWLGENVYVRSHNRAEILRVEPWEKY